MMANAQLKRFPVALLIQLENYPNLKVIFGLIKSCLKLRNDTSLYFHLISEIKSHLIW